MTASLWDAPLTTEPGTWDVGPLYVPTMPRPQGSKKAFVPKHKKGTPADVAAKPRRPVIVNDEPELLKTFRADVRDAFQRAMKEAGLAPLEGAIEVAVTFTFRRPQHHHVAGDRTRPLKANAPTYHVQDPDLDKLLRSVADALTGIIWANDNLIARWCDPVKLWGLRDGIELAARRIR